MAALHVAIVITNGKEVVGAAGTTAGLLLLWSPWRPSLVSLVAVVTVGLLLVDVVGHVQAAHRKSDQCVQLGPPHRVL